MADFDGDGFTDLFVANDAVQQFLYRNLGDGRFEDVALGAFAAFDQDGKAFSGMGTDAADYDNDGRPDVVVTNLSNQCYALYRNLGDRTFSYETHASGLGRISLLSSGWGVRFLDYDNDGWKDLFLVQGHVLDTIELTSPHLRYRQPPLLARNEGGRFRDVSAGAGDVFRTEWAARGLAIGDIDDDGDLDIVVSTLDDRGRVLRNEGGNAGHWIELRLVGRRSNRDGIGAEVRLTTASGADSAGHRPDRGRLPLGRRPARPPRPGGGAGDPVDRDPLAERDGPAPDRRRRGPDPDGHRAGSPGLAAVALFPWLSEVVDVQPAIGVIRIAARGRAPFAGEPAVLALQGRQAGASAASWRLLRERPRGIHRRPRRAAVTRLTYMSPCRSTRATRPRRPIGPGDRAGAGAAVSARSGRGSSSTAGPRAPCRGSGWAPPPCRTRACRRP